MYVEQRHNQHGSINGCELIRVSNIGWKDGDVSYNPRQTALWTRIYEHDITYPYLLLSSYASEAQLLVGLLYRWYGEPERCHRALPPTLSVRVVDLYRPCS